MSAESKSNGGGLARKLGLFLGPVIAMITWIILAQHGVEDPIPQTAAVAVLMALWWMTEAIPISATALIPVALFPILGILSGRAVAGSYFNNVIFLFLGGFIMALAMEKWELHKRIALKTIIVIGAGPRRMLLGFMLATAFLSMWISNTATTMMMVPIAIAVISRLHAGDENRRIAAGLLIAVAYSASIGGIATLIGTPPNLAFAKIFTTSFPNAPEVTFTRWIVFGLPASAVLFIVAYVVLILTFFRGAKASDTDLEELRREYRELGKASFEEKMVGGMFALMAILWLTRQDLQLGSFVIPGWARLLPTPQFIDDGTVAIVVSLFLFIIPSRSRTGARLIDWQTARRLPWGIVILFGGGFALAEGFKDSGLSQFIAQQLHVLQGVSPLVVVLVICLVLTFLTELTSNTATTQIVLPLLAAMALAVEVNPLLLMIPATLSASCAFMLPVATPPNAIVFGSGMVRMPDMMRAGIYLNLIGAVVITILMFALGMSVFNINTTVMPPWAG